MTRTEKTLTASYHRAVRNIEAPQELRAVGLSTGYIRNRRTVERVLAANGIAYRVVAADAVGVRLGRTAQEAEETIQRLFGAC